MRLTGELVLGPMLRYAGTCLWKVVEGSSFSPA
jgi:hypothetical protein